MIRVPFTTLHGSRKRRLNKAILILLSALSIGLIPAASTPTVSSRSVPPPVNGYFPNLIPQGDVFQLPSGQVCAGMVHRSSWEPRPDNSKRNHYLVDAQAVHDSFAARPRSSDGTYDKRWDSWLLPRVDGQFTGTTDEIFQWAACKWGLPDNYLRAIAVRESTWYQYDTYSSYGPRPNRCVEHYSCGDRFGTEKYSDRKIYCDGLAQFGWDYQLDESPWGDALCPKTMSIVGIMSWENPSWVYPSPPYAGNQNGTFPFTRNSTAMAVDYIGSYLRGCYEGWIFWLNKAGGDIWGCIGSWYSGDWHSSNADGYISRVQNELNNHTWLTQSFFSFRPPCDPTYGCPGPDTLP